jgi:hypothetical protein
MKRDPSAPHLSAVFVDYDNIYLSLKRRNEDAAKRFSKDAGAWLRGIETGRLITSNGSMIADAPRRIVLNRCYGNPVPRRNQADNSTDMNSFPFVRHHFLRSGFEIVDCPPLTSQQKNAADIRMVMDLRDYLTHDTYFDEFIILSGDADFTPVLHRLRQHARRTVIYSNDHTAAAYAAICDGEVRESDLIAALIGNPAQIEAPQTAPPQAAEPQLAQPQIMQSAPIVLQTAPVPVQRAAAPAPHPAQLRLEDLRQMIMAEVVAGIRAASGPVPLEALADRAIRALGHERTVGTAWAGAGSFRELMRVALPNDLRLSENPPYYAYDPQRHVVAQPAPPEVVPVAPQQTIAQQREALAAAMAELTQSDPVDVTPPVDPRQAESRPSRYATIRPSQGPAPKAQPVAPPAPVPAPAPLAARAAATEPQLHRSAATRSAPPAPTQQARPDPHAAAQSAMLRIQEACQAPAISANDYRALFEAMAEEISLNGLTGAQTLTAVGERAEARGIMVRREDVRFVLDVVSEPDPWFEQGATPTLFAGRFRNFVVARCRDHGLQLSATELDLIDGWIMGAAPQATQRAFAPEPPVRAPSAPAAQAREPAGRWWSLDEGRNQAADQRAAAPSGESEDDFPRIIRARQR